MEETGFFFFIFAGRLMLYEFIGGDKFILDDRERRRITNIFIKTRIVSLFRIIS